ncbi:MAG: UDP-N-acetylglucosamine--N-acetylmuramyl-(pentapeptide) pyrophosphoryl-undecaprenol N-acetylglucosamine transferase [Chlamydiota bacterium]
MVKRVLIAVGGTGGHVYPAVALARKLKEKDPDIYLTFAGGGLNDSRFFDRAEFPYEEVACGYFPLRKPITLLKSLGKVASGILQSDKIIKEFKPNIVVGFGSYHTLPVLLTAKMRSIPIVLHEGNAVPGRVNRLLAKHAVFTGIQFPGAANLLKGKTVEIDAPLREEVQRNQQQKSDSLNYFNLNSEKNTLLVFGGSQGAFAINRLMTHALSKYPGDLQTLQVIHFTGNKEECERVRKHYDDIKVEHCVKDFEREIGKAWNVADLVVGRAGAGTIAEALEFEVPAVLIPYNYAMDDHQARNGEFMANIVGGALIFNEGEIDAEKLAGEIFNLLQKEPMTSQKMKQCMKDYKDKVQQQDLSTLVAELIP